MVAPRLIGMNRTIKIMVAFSCMMFGCVLTTTAQSMLTSDMAWLSPVFTGFGFVLMIVAGLYSFLKAIKPLVY
jgi:hypothetical protein